MSRARWLLLCASATAGCLAPGGPSSSTAAVPVDGDADGVPLEDDCDDADPAVGLPLLLHADTDADGFGDPDVPVEACEVGAGATDDATDCDDTDAAVYPGAPDRYFTAEICDTDEVVAPILVFRKHDSSGFDTRRTISSAINDPNEHYLHAMAHAPGSDGVSVFAMEDGTGACSANQFMLEEIRYRISTDTFFAIDYDVDTE